MQTSLAAAQQLSSRGRTFKVGDAKSAEDILESVHDVVTDYHRQADHKLPEERNADVGVLAKAKKKKCTKGFVNCVNGFVKGSGNAITCKDACSGSCCVGNSAFPDACEKFTGQICKDQSCSGKKACTNASIKSVVNSCRGSSACYKVAVPCPSPTYSYGCKDYNAVTGRVGPVVNSCTGDEACALAGSADGRIGSIQDSCNGKSACYAAGGLGGRVQSIRNSCNDDRACLLIGRRGQVGSIQNSCGGYTACRFLGDDGYVGSIKDSCFGYGACAETGAFDNDIGGVESIKDSCKGDSSCAHTATNGGSIGSIRDSCIDSGACFGAGGFGGNVLSIVGSCIGIASCSGLGIGVGGGTGKLVQSCNGASACSSAGAADGYTGAGDQSGVDFGFGVLDTVGTGPIDSNMRGCCNGPELCDGVNEVTLPVNCK
jgi:hypothetical protein